MLVLVPPPEVVPPLVPVPEVPELLVPPVPLPVEPVPEVPEVPDVPEPLEPVPVLPEVPELLVPLLLDVPELLVPEALEVVDGLVVDAVVLEAGVVPLADEELELDADGSDAFCGAERSGVRAGTRSCVVLLPPQAVTPTARTIRARDAVTRRRIGAKEGVSARAPPAEPCAARRSGSR